MDEYRRMRLILFAQPIPLLSNGLVNNSPDNGWGKGQIMKINN